MGIFPTVTLMLKGETGGTTTLGSSPQPIGGPGGGGGGSDSGPNFEGRPGGSSGVVQMVRVLFGTGDVWSSRWSRPTISIKWMGK